MKKNIKNSDFILRRKIHIYTNNFKIWSKSILIFFTVIIITISYSYISTAIKNLFITISADAGFKLNNIIIEGRKNFNVKQFLAKFNADNNTPIFLIDLDEIKNTAQQSKWVKQVFVMRKLPNTIIIKILEAQPIGVWQIMRKFFVIDKDGNQVESDIENFAHLPHFVGEGANIYAAQLLESIGDKTEILNNIQSMVRINNRRWNFILTNGAIIKMPEKNTQIALNFLNDQYLTDPEAMQNIKVLDMRDEEKYYVEQQEKL